ncbi:hypothetical protein A2635_01605 [Candidatus Peribacteria bacterium RIFCSPHIGHO2_01_FULL_51_9]|nr:MAG: hypothetical protein A2635_01605 [Candidatus Peribacteria bacterium RIFCSPHIGHO2_01_FULL_51_9]
MKSRDVILSICSLLLGIALGASSMLYAQEVAYIGVPTEAARSGKFHAVPKKAAAPSQYKRRTLNRTNTDLLRKPARPISSGTQ